MIFAAILTAIANFLGIIFSFLPNVDTLPYGIDAVITNGIGYYKYFASYFPPLTTVLTVGSIYISFRLALLFLKVFLGHRAPHHA